MNLDADFEAAVGEAALDQLERRAREEIAPKLREYAHEILREYGAEHGYDVESVIESAETRVERHATGVTVQVGWEAEESVYFAFGTSDHPVGGDPLLVFEFDKQEYPGLAEMFPEGTAFLPEANVSGLPESRYVRDALNRVRRELDG